MRKLKTILLVLLALSLCVSGAFAAEDKTHLEIVGEERAALFAGIDALDTSGKTYDEKVEISIALPNIKSGADYNTADLLTLWFREHFNFDWNIEALPSEGIDDKVRTMINSNSMPDILRWDNFYIAEVVEYINQGYFYQFPEDWRERWPNLAALQDATPVPEILRERTDGNTYCLFRPTFFFNNPTEKGTDHFGVFLRKDWAEAVGFELKDVYTPSELLEYARLIKEEDPGQVGELLVPLSLYTSNARDTFLTASYPQFDEIYKENGEYKWGFADERTLAGLEIWKQAYDEGLIGKEFYTLNSDDSKNAYQVSGVSGGFCNATNQGWVGDVYEDMEAQGLKPEDCIWVAAVVGEDGYYHGSQSKNFWGVAYFSSDIAPEVFERYMDICEFTVNRDIQLFMNVGFENVDWKYNENGEVEKINGNEWVTSWPLYHLMSICGDDFVADKNNVSEFSWLGEKYSKKVYEIKDQLVVDGSIMPIDRDTYGFSSEIQNMMTEINYKSILANLIVAEGDLEENWKAVIDEYAYIVEPAVNELNELFGE
ncbi:MAG: hypothetical protein IKJ65_07650 [Clostridia bacterium]|nr:hypothetical protein [Clostridia bacterium]